MAAERYLSGRIPDLRVGNDIDRIDKEANPGNFMIHDKSALIINFEGREVKGLSKGRYDETFAG